jgi:colicin import membrane protein
MELANDTLERIFAAADALYEQAGHTEFPTVDAVRKTARVNMNDANAGMKRWRHAHMAQAVPVAVQVPESVQQAGGAALAVLWREAQELAHEALRAAQAGWDAERAEADTLNKQIADAYEVQAAELDAARTDIAHAKADTDRLSADKAQLDGQLDDARRGLASALGASERMEVRAIEIERRAGELRAELDYAHQEVERARSELADTRHAHTAEIDALRGELAALRTKAESERDKALIEVGHAREDVAALRAQVDAVNEQHMVLKRARPRKKTAGDSKNPSHSPEGLQPQHPATRPEASHTHSGAKEPSGS